MKANRLIQGIASIPMAFLKFIQVNFGIGFDGKIPPASNAREHSSNKKVIKKVQIVGV